MTPAPSPDPTSLCLLRAIYDKTGGRNRAVRDVTELESGLTAEQAKSAWSALLDRGLIERFSLDYAARLSAEGLDFIQNAPLPSAPPPPPTPARKLFLVRGSDRDARDALVRTLAQSGHEAIFLSAEPGGKTIMEQAEAHRDVDFALLLLTPDEIRSPMNLLMELGYFMGRLGPTRVRILATNPALGLPTDLAGIPITLLDTAVIAVQL